MSVLDQCFSIIDLTSLDWPEEERFGVVGHSVRVMAIAKNYDEMVVGLMHALYAASSYARDLYHCDVEGDPEWQKALDLFVVPLKRKKSRIPDGVPGQFNVLQNLSEGDRQEWMQKEPLFSPPYERYIRKIGGNRIARNVMIHKLEDLLVFLQGPEESSDGSGTLTDWERNNLIEKYMRALEILEDVEKKCPVRDDYTEEEHLKHEQACLRWFNDWAEFQKILAMDCYNSVEEDGYEAGSEEILS